MKIDIERLDERIRKLQELRRLASDPEMNELLCQLVQPNGAATSALRDNDHPAVRSSAARHSSKKKQLRGTLTTAVKQAALAKSGPFDGYALTHEMQESGYRFAAQKPSISVLDVLRRMTRAGQLKLVREGMAGAPNLYEVVPSSA